jgi:glutamate-1-semialdehyde aminotransferase
MPGGAVCGRADLMDLLGGPAAGPARVAHPGTHNAHALSAAAGVTTLGLAAPGELQARADRLAASLRGELTAAFRAGRGGRLRLRRELDVPPAVRARGRPTGSTPPR